MRVKELPLPASLVDAMETGRLYRERGSWQLKRNVDAYGTPLETELAFLYPSVLEMKTASENLANEFRADYYREADPQREEQPGFIPDILDFDLIVCFGTAGGGEPFCLDFRDDRVNPSVIWWDDWYWRRIAPDFDSFLGLFDLEED